jgi:hypothetical protein
MLIVVPQDSRTTLKVNGIRETSSSDETFTAGFKRRRQSGALWALPNSLGIFYSIEWLLWDSSNLVKATIHQTPQSLQVP